MIAGLIMTAIYGALVGTIQTKQFVEKDIDDVKVGSVIFELIQRDIQSACPVRPGQVLFKCKDGRLSRAGTGRINFLTARWSRFPDESYSKSGDDDEPPPRSSICEVGYFIRPNPDHADRFELYRREDFYVDGEFEKGGLYLKLSAYVKELSFRFYKGDEEEKNAEPVESWDGEEAGHLPKAVAVRLVVDRSLEGESGPDSEWVFESVIPIAAGTDPPPEEEEEE
jgi:hypothetical protein